MNADQSPTPTAAKKTIKPVAKTKPAAKNKPGPKPRQYNSHYLPVTDAELQQVCAYSTTSAKGDEAFAAFQDSQACSKTARGRVYRAEEDRWLTRLRRYLTFFKGRSTSDGKMASGWPITPEKFVLWAYRDPRPTIRSLTTYLQTVEAARAATQHLFLADFPDLLAQQSLTLDIRVEDTIAHFTRLLAQEAAPKDAESSTAQPSSSTQKKASPTKLPCTRQNTTAALTLGPSKVNKSQTQQNSTSTPKASTSKTGPSTGQASATTRSSTANPQSSTMTNSLSNDDTPRATTDDNNLKARLLNASKGIITPAAIRLIRSNLQPNNTPQGTADTPQVHPNASKDNIRSQPNSIKLSLPKTQFPAQRIRIHKIDAMQGKTPYHSNNGRRPAVPRNTASTAQASTSTAKSPTISTFRAPADSPRVPAQPSTEAFTPSTAKRASVASTACQSAQTTTPQTSPTNPSEAFPKTATTTTTPQTTPVHPTQALPKIPKASSAAPTGSSSSLPPKEKQYRSSAPAASHRRRTSKEEYFPDSSEITSSTHHVPSKVSIQFKPESSQRIHSANSVPRSRLPSEEITFISGEMKPCEPTPQVSRSSAPLPQAAEAERVTSPEPTSTTTKPQSRKLSESSGDCPLALLPRSCKRIKTRQSQPSPAPAQETLPELDDHPPLECVDEQDHKFVQPPIYDQVSVFTDIRDPEIRDACLEALRRDHQNNLSTEDVLEGLSAEMEALTGAGGELASIGSKEELAECLKTYLEFWAQEGISGFPMHALKMCVWLEAMEPEVTKKEAADLSLSFDRLARLIAAGFPQDEQGSLFHYSASILHTPLCHSFFDHYGWPLPAFSDLPVHTYQTFDEIAHPRSVSPFSSIGSSLSSLPPSPSPSVEIPGLRSSDPSGNRDLESIGPDEELTGEHHQQLAFRRDSIHCPEHQQFLRNLRQFIQLLS
ncbi:hypothetical protein PCANC_28881 [Puccinia coronata f. sp. avenae]|uniref:Uncharacterized protein n=1 Tax=Puccinia coronata f. sp. avenae TaxID=200324 RepID=A0A2N5RTX7_9BASI|nr:hypothetical protein PCANC_28881 [Puccinia coronata f. sp. avenae]